MSEDPLTPESLASVSVTSETSSHPDGQLSNDGQQRPGTGRRRRRRRRRGGRGGQPGGGGGNGNGGAPFERPEEVSAAGSGPERPVEGVLYLPPKESAAGVLVSAKANYLPSPKDPLVPRDLINRESLEAGAYVTAVAVDGNRPVVRRIELVEGLEIGRAHV